MTKRRLHLRVNERDWERMQLIRETFGVSLSAAFRVAVRAACVQLQLQQGEDILVEELLNASTVGLLKKK